MRAANGRRPVIGVSTAVVASILIASCALVPSRLPASVEGTPTASSCSVSAMRACGLPFPSDEFTVADPTTATGRRVALPADLVPDRVLSALGPGAGPADASRSADGFSALTPVMFELDRAVLPGSIPADGGDVVAVFDVTTGARVPLRVEVPIEAARHGAPETMVVAWPMTRYDYGHTYIARITDAANARDGRLLRAPGLSEPGGTVDELRDTLAQVEGDEWDHVLGATSFTVRSADNATHELDAMNQVVRSQDHPIRNLAVQLPFLIPNASAVISGEVRLTDFRDAAGLARVANGGSETWAPFMMVLPETVTAPDGAPVVIYGHGLTAAKETMVATASVNAAAGMATIGIDVPNHGGRQAGQGGYLLDIANSKDLGRLASMPLQGIVDQVSLLLAVQDHMGDLALLLPDLPGRIGVPAPDLDVDHVYYEGTSMGGMLGAAFTALAPELDGSFLQVAGAGIADTIFHSLLWVLFMGVVPDAANTGEAYTLLGAATLLLDPADSVNVIGRIRENGTPTFLVYGVGDGVVPNHASDRLISLLDLPLVGQQITEVSLPFRTADTTVPADGYGFAQIWPNAAPDTQSFLAHLSFTEPRALRILDEWLRGRLVEDGLA